MGAVSRTPVTTANIRADLNLVDPNRDQHDLEHLNIEREKQKQSFFLFCVLYLKFPFLLQNRLANIPNYPVATEREFTQQRGFYFH